MKVKISAGAIVMMALLFVQSANGAKAFDKSFYNDVRLIVETKQRIEILGFDRALEESNWPEIPPYVPESKVQGLDSFGGAWGVPGQTGTNDLAWDDCNFNPSGPSCSTFPSTTGAGVAGPLKDDAVQILATEVLYQTLTYFKVKHVFAKLKDKPNTWGFKVIEPVDGAPYADLNTEAVVYAVRQFRKYVIGIICNQPNPSRILAMMNKYNVGNRFRWDMAWALLGNDLPDTPNKYMSFGMKWRKFSLALDGISNGSMMRVMNPYSGGWQGFDPSAGGVAAPVKSGGAKIGYIANEAIGIMRLVGDIVAAVLELFCVSDLNVNAKKEGEKQNVVYKLLALKKVANDRYGPLRKYLDDVGAKATAASGKPVTVLP